MNKKILSIIVITVIAFWCTACRNKTETVKTGNNICNKNEKKEGIFSVSELSGTTWVADYSNRDKEYRVSFTNTAFVTKTSLFKFGRSYSSTHPYYLSGYQEKDFDASKVGTDTKGDYLIIYLRGNKERSVHSAKLKWGMPGKLLMIESDRDTVAYTMCK